MRDVTLRAEASSPDNLFMSIDRALAKLEKQTAQAGPEARRQIAELREMLEEFKVAVFAPELKTAYPVSAKRLAAKIREINEAGRA